MVTLSRLFKQILSSWVSKNKDCGDVRRDIRNDSNSKTKEEQTDITKQIIETRN